MGMVGREFRLRDALEEVAHRYGWIIIDCPPSLNLLTLNALTSSQQVIIPLQTEFLALQGLAKIKQVIRWTTFAEARRVTEHLMSLATPDEADAWLAGYIAERKRQRGNGGDR